MKQRVALKIKQKVATTCHAFVFLRDDKKRLEEIEMEEAQREQTEEKPYSMMNHVKKPVPVKSFHSEDWYDTVCIYIYIYIYICVCVYPLTLSQMTNFILFQIERVCRRQFQI